MRPPECNGIDERGELESRSAVAIVANLPRGIAQREADTIVKLLNWDLEGARIVETEKLRGSRETSFWSNLRVVTLQNFSVASGGLVRARKV